MCYVKLCYRNFLTTIKFVDERIKEIEGIIKDFYNNDGRTTFLMTSDHGMTDWGMCSFYYSYFELTKKYGMPLN